MIILLNSTIEHCICKNQCLIINKYNIFCIINEFAKYFNIFTWEIFRLLFWERKFTYCQTFHNNRRYVYFHRCYLSDCDSTLIFLQNDTQHAYSWKKVLAWKKVFRLRPQRGCKLKNEKIITGDMTKIHASASYPNYS